jgi:hypothetical protein
MQIEVSIGEVLDKVSILTIKLNKLTKTEQLRNVARELGKITKVLPKGILEDDLYQQLCKVNMKLWDIEDKIRECESKLDFGKEFIELARSVYYTNDERATIKKQININYKSELIEEKSYHHIN